VRLGKFITWLLAVGTIGGLCVFGLFLGLFERGSNN
jgi:hypothetical protein